MKKGFSLIELLIYVSIFAVAGGMMLGILALILKVNQRESSTGEITSQMNFISQTISRLVRSSSNIEIDAGVATSTLKLRMKNSAKDPTCIYLDSVNKIIKLAEGPDTNPQNCSPTASNLTNDRIKVDKLEFIKSTQYPGNDSVSMNIQMSYNSPNPGAQATREIKSASMRFSTAEFSDNILPFNDALYDIGSSTSRWRNAAFSGNLFVAGNVGIGTTTPSEKLTVVDGNISNINNTPVKVGTATLPIGENMESGESIAVSGRYAYVLAKTTTGNPNIVEVIDVSNLSSPAKVGMVTLNPGEAYGESIAVSGRYAYVLTYTNPAKIVIVDVSNPSSPARVGVVNLNLGEEKGESIAVSGRYAYIVTDTTSTQIVAIDVSNPSSPT
ncbi:MAG: prepilin-type N-terminal cleavage/methylation domain-containing protein, partial [Patescibacteria group bacterium]